MKVSQNGINLIKDFEGFRSEAYLCPAGVPTIGYGSTRIHGKAVVLGMTCTKEEAEEFLWSDVQVIEEGISRLVTAPISQEQFDACVDFVYNLGIGNFGKSTLLKLINVRDYNAAANEFPKWNRANGKPLPGLTRRRKAEQDLFLTRSVSAFVADALPT